MLFIVVCDLYVMLDVVRYEPFLSNTLVFSFSTDVFLTKQNPAHVSIYFIHIRCSGTGEGCSLDLSMFLINIIG